MNAGALHESIAELKTKVAEACRIVAHSGLAKGTLGHVSARVPDTDLVLIKGKGIAEEGMEFTSERDIVTMNLKGEVLDAREGLSTPGETAMHLGVLRRRPEIQSVVHAHPDWVVILTSAGKPLVPMLNAYDGGSSRRLVKAGIPTYPRSLTITTDELADDMMRTMGEKNVCLLSGHGVCVAGTSIETAASTSLSLYELARMNYLTYAIGTPQAVSDDDEMTSGGRRPALSADRMSSFWRYETRRLPRLM